MRLFCCLVCSWIFSCRRTYVKFNVCIEVIWFLDRPGRHKAEISPGVSPGLYYIVRAATAASRRGCGRLVCAGSPQDQIRHLDLDHLGRPWTPPPASPVSRRFNPPPPKEQGQRDPLMRRRSANSIRASGHEEGRINRPHYRGASIAWRCSETKKSVIDLPTPCSRVH